MHVYFRIFLNKNSGLGHFQRSQRLAEQFIKKGINTSLIIDHKLQSINLFNNKNIKYLYKKNETYSIKKDIRKFINLTKVKRGIIIVDDYRVNNEWIKEIQKIHYKLAIFDDHFREIKNANFIINTKPDFLLNYYKKKYSKINKNTQLLLGPKYSVLSKISKIKKKKKFNILFYLGGSNDTNLLIKIIASLKKNYSKFDKNFKYYLVIGPFSKNKKNLYKIFNYKNLKILDKQKDVISNYNFVDLFVGSSGMSLYENKYYNIPSIFFQMSENQKINIEAAKLLGFYFFLEKKNLIQSEKISKLILEIYKNYNKIKNYLTNSKFKLDNYGSKRIFDAIISNKKINENIKSFDFYNKNFFSKVNLSHINDYLNSRNLTKNRNQSINNKKISTLDHYIWWFTTNRNSKAYYYKGKVILFLHHEIISINKTKFIFTGWFSSSEINNINFLKFIKIISIHTKNVDKIVKQTSCRGLSLIGVKNKSMIKLTEAMKWTRIISKKKLKIIYDHFGIKKNKNFLVYEKN